MNKAEAYQLWRSRTIRYRGRYWTLEEGRWVPGVSFAKFWKTVQLQQRLLATDPGGDIVL